MQNSSILMLDCTLRDGGHGLEDMKIRGFGKNFFCEKKKESIVKSLVASNIEIIELGSASDGQYRDVEVAAYKGVEDLSDDYQRYLEVNSQNFAILYRDPHLYKLSIPHWIPGLPKIARVIMRYFDLPKSFDFCRLLADKGYNVFIQPMATMQYSNLELEKLASLANEIKAGALYIVDSYGTMVPNNVRRIFNSFDLLLSPYIRIGFHGHDNLSLAYSNSLDFISITSKRNKIVDSTLYGMGLGAGNCRSEIICSYLNKKFSCNYLIEELLDGCEVIESITGKDQSWGVGLVNTLPALENLATKYVYTLRYEYKLGYKEIYRIMKKIPSKIRQQYTKENMKSVLKLL